MAQVVQGAERMADLEKGLARGAALANSLAAQLPGFLWKDPLADLHQEMAKVMAEGDRALAEQREAQSAKGFVRRLEAQIRVFEAQLDAAHDVGVRLVDFGKEITFHVTEIGCIEPSLITFTGTTGKCLRSRSIS